MSDDVIRGGYTGEYCGKCKATVNVELWKGRRFPSGGPPGFNCERGHYNVMSLSSHMIPHENPDKVISF